MGGSGSVWALNTTPKYLLLALSGSMLLGLVIVPQPTQHSHRIAFAKQETKIAEATIRDPSTSITAASGALEPRKPSNVHSHLIDDSTHDGTTDKLRRRMASKALPRLLEAINEENR